MLRVSMQFQILLECSAACECKWICTIYTLHNFGINFLLIKFVLVVIQSHHHQLPIRENSGDHTNTVANLSAELK